MPQRGRRRRQSQLHTDNDNPPNSHPAKGAGASGSTTYNSVKFIVPSKSLCRRKYLRQINDIYLRKQKAQPKAAETPWPIVQSRHRPPFRRTAPNSSWVTSMIWSGGMATCLPAINGQVAGALGDPHPRRHLCLPALAFAFHSSSWSASRVASPAWLLGAQPHDLVVLIGGCRLHGRKPIRAQLLDQLGRLDERALA